MRTLIAVLLLTLALSAHAKDTALNAGWNGIWSDASGQHRCGVHIVDGTGSRLVVLCQLGPDGVYANVAPMPDPGWQIFVDRTATDFGKPGDGHIRWGQISWHGLCDRSGPKIVANIAAVFNHPNAVDVTFRPVTVSNPASLCVGGAP